MIIPVCIQEKLTYIHNESYSIAAMAL